jgi:endonuclease YncB( thermonuclease family)
MVPWSKGLAVLAGASILWLVPAWAGAELSGRVVGVSDGDTITVLLRGDRSVEVRLSEIDAPERGQPYGTRAKQALSALVYGKDVRLVPVDRDSYGRIVARVFVGPMCVNAEMVRRGHAWVYRRYLRTRALLEREREAREARRGLWALPEAQRIPPWMWRSAGRPPRGSPDPPGVRDLQRPGVRPSRGGEAAVIGNRESRVYHWPGCPNYGAVSVEHRRYFPSRAAAEAAGYRPARNCP